MEPETIEDQQVTLALNMADLLRKLPGIEEDGLRHGAAFNVFCLKLLAATPATAEAPEQAAADGAIVHDESSAHNGGM